MLKKDFINKPFAVKKIAAYLSGKIKMPASIGIAGETASGFTLTDKVKDAFDFKIYVDIPENIKRERFFIRASERGLGDSAEIIYANANKKAEFYIRPCKSHADIVLSGYADRIKYKNFVNKILGLIQELYLAE